MIDTLCAVRDQLGESPVWSVAEQALYWVDIEGRRIHRFDWATRAERSWATPERIGCIALAAGGGLLAAMETGLFRVAFDDGADTGAGARFALAHPATFPRPAMMRFNDGRTDRAGRFWVTSMVRDTALGIADGALFRCDARGLSGPLVGSLITGNGLAFSPAGDVAYLADSHPSVRQIWAFDLDADGRLSNRRRFVDMTQHPGRPDGAAVDADGAYWSCANDGAVVHRFLPDGRLDRSIRLPVSKPSMCAFGGPALEHLFVTSIRPQQPVAGYDPGLDGAVWVLRPGAVGIAEAPFGGGAPL